MQPKEPTPREKDKTNEKVQVILRVRPYVESEEPEEFISALENHTISINKPGFTSYMKFSYVQQSGLKEGEGQRDMFSSVEDAVRCIFEGIDSTIFAYGQTGAGKTYTIMGNCPEVDSDFEFYKNSLCSVERGILPRALEVVFEEQRRKRNSRITISFFEIYNQKIFDLLANNLKALEIRESKGEITIVGLMAVEAMSMKEVINYLAEGIRNRVTSSTTANMKSSRSHSIFHIKYEQLVVNPETKEHQVLVANLRVVDLAGSEKFNIPNDISPSERELKIQELKAINGSLSKLGHCISSLSIQSRTHIPVRDSKLTRILSDSLLGSGKIRLIICVSPSITYMNETSSTLQFADRVKKAVFERPVSLTQEKKKVDYDEFLSLQEELEKERAHRIRLEGMLAEVRMQPSQMSLIRQNQRLKHEVAMLKQKLKTVGNEDNLNTSRAKSKSNRSVSGPYKKSLSPRYEPLRKTAISKPSTASKLRSTSNLKQGNYTNVKSPLTPPKAVRPKSYHELDSKSQNMSVDEAPQRRPKKSGKEKTFQNKIKMFMERNEVDRDLEEKVKRRLIEIKQEIALGSKEWLESEESTGNLWDR